MNKETEAEKITIKVNNQDLLCEKNEYTKYYPSGTIKQIKVCKKEVKQQINNNTTTITQQSQPILFTINGEKQILELVNDIGFFENGHVKSCHFTNKNDRIIVNIAKKRQAIHIYRDKIDNTSYCSFHNNGNLNYTRINEDEPQTLILEIGDIEQTIDVKWEIYFYDDGKLNKTYIDKPSDIEVYINNKKILLKLDNSSSKPNGFLEKICDFICFFPDGTLKEAKICEDITLNVKFHGKDYDLPFKSGDDIIFTDNKELSQSCIDKSPERSAIVYAERLNKLEKSQEKTKQEVKELQINRNIANVWDWIFVLITCGIGFYFILSALGLCFGKPIWPFNLITPENFDKMCFNYGFSFLNPEHETFNKYTFFFEILKRAPIIILVILGFKFLQLAFKRIELVGEVEKVQKYINLTNDDTTKNKLLKIIALPFFVPKKMKSSVKFMDDFRSVILEKEENK